MISIKAEGIQDFPHDQRSTAADQFDRAVSARSVPTDPAAAIADFQGDSDV